MLTTTRNNMNIGNNVDNKKQQSQKYVRCMKCNTVCVEIFAVVNFRGCITLRIFADFIFAVVGQIKFIIFQFKMFELKSFIRGFMFNMYRGCLAKERYFIALENR